MFAKAYLIITYPNLLEITQLGYKYNLNYMPTISTKIPKENICYQFKYCLAKITYIVP